MNPQPKPKPTNLMEVISIKHDEGVENPCLHRVAREWADRLGVTEMAASQTIVAFLQLPPRPYKRQPRPPPERAGLVRVARRLRVPAGSTTATNPSSARGPTITSCSAASNPTGTTT